MDDVTIMPYSHTGVHLSLGSGNNSNILITDIGEGDSDALLCYTDFTQCCRGIDSPNGIALGEWLYPNDQRWMLLIVAMIFTVTEDRV